MDINEQALKEVQDQCHMLGVKALTYCVDVTSEVQVEKLSVTLSLILVAWMV